MKADRLIVAFLCVCGVLLAQGGCEESERPVEKPGPVVAEVNEPPVVVPEVNEPERTEPNAPEPKPAAGGPQIRFDKVVHEFGEIAPGSYNNCQFKFKNVGDELLKIVNIKADCGCTVPTLEKKEYAPGESGTIKIKYHATSRGASVTRNTVVTTNQKTNPKITLKMKAKIVSKVSVAPSRLNIVLKDDANSLPEITLTSLDGKAFSIRQITSSGGAITADIDTSVEATKFVLQPRVDKEKIRRVTSGMIQIGLTHPECKSVTVTFNALTPFRINPPVILLLDSKAGVPVTRDNVSILNNYGDDWEIASTSSKSGSVKVLKQEKIGNGYKFSLEITPPDLQGKATRFTDEFLVQVKDGELLKIMCRMFYARKRL